MATTPLKSGKGTGGCQPGSSSYHTRSLYRGWNWLWVLSANSHRTSEHASDCSEVCAESVDPGSERQSSSDLSGTEGTVINDPTLLLNVVSGDESIAYAYDPETKLQSSQWTLIPNCGLRIISLHNFALKSHNRIFI